MSLKNLNFGQETNKSSEFQRFSGSLYAVLPKISELLYIRHNARVENFVVELYHVLIHGVSELYLKAQNCHKLSGLTLSVPFAHFYPNQIHRLFIRTVEN